MCFIMICYTDTNSFAQCTILFKYLIPVFICLIIPSILICIDSHQIMSRKMFSFNYKNILTSFIMNVQFTRNWYKLRNLEFGISFPNRMNIILELLFPKLSYFYEYVACSFQNRYFPHCHEYTSYVPFIKISKRSEKLVQIDISFFLLNRANFQLKHNFELKTIKILMHKQNFLNNIQLSRLTLINYVLKWVPSICYQRPLIS